MIIAGESLCLLYRVSGAGQLVSGDYVTVGAPYTGSERTVFITYMFHQALDMYLFVMLTLVLC